MQNFFLRMKIPEQKKNTRLTLCPAVTDVLLYSFQIVFIEKLFFQILTLNFFTGSLGSAVTFSCSLTEQFLRFY